MQVAGSRLDVMRLLGHEFADPALAERALTHRSASARHNERLEFLGDAVIGLVVADMLHRSHPHASEGQLTRWRAWLVNGSALADMARAQELGPRMVLGRGELCAGAVRRDSLLEDAFEASVGAIFLDAGFAACQACIEPMFASRMQELGQGDMRVKDAKTRLQEWLQARGLALPEYHELARSGPDNDPIFEVACELEGAVAGRHVGKGPSLRAAGKAAAQAALDALEGVQ